MFRSHFTDDLQQKLFAAQNTVLADTLFTLPAGLVQLGSGIWLAWYAGFPLHQGWLFYSLCLFLLAGLCWLPVVWIQIQLRRIIKVAIAQSAPLPQQYHRLFTIWFVLGWPAFLALVVIFYLMVVKPA